MSFGVPVLVWATRRSYRRSRGGSPEAEPDAMLTEVHRQAVDNSIVQPLDRTRAWANGRDRRLRRRTLVVRGVTTSIRNR